jgi:hypothetical protein
MFLIYFSSSKIHNLQEAQTEYYSSKTFNGTWIFCAYPKTPYCVRNSYMNISLLCKRAQLVSASSAVALEWMIRFVSVY